MNEIIENENARHYVCERSLLYFIVYYFSEYLTYPFAPFHHDMIQGYQDLIEGEINELCLIGFRESAKTSIARLGLVWTICYNKKHNTNYDSYDKSNAETALFDVVSALQTNEKIIADFGHLYNKLPEDKDKPTMKRIGKFMTNNDVMVEAFSTQESARGRNVGGKRPDLFIFDDFENEKTIESEAITLKVQAHIDTVRSGLSVDGCALYLGNYISEVGTVAHIMERLEASPKGRVIFVSAIEDGEPTWPGKYVLTDKELELDENKGKVSLESKKKELGYRVFDAEMLNKPYSEEDAEFKKSWFKPRSLDYILGCKHSSYLTVDTAVSEKSSADYTAFCLNFVDTDNNWHIGIEQDRINPTELINRLFQLHNQYKFKQIGIEKTIFLMAIQPFLLQEMRKRNIFLPIYELQHQQTAKEARIRTLIPRYENGTVFHLEGMCGDLESNLMRFPRSIHDDDMDALAYQLQIAKPPTSNQMAAQYGAAANMNRNPQRPLVSQFK